MNENKSDVEERVVNQMQRLRTEGKVELCYTPIYKMAQDCHKIIFHNVRSLHAHYKDIKVDNNYLSADFIGFAESRLTSIDLNENYALPNFAILRNDKKQTGRNRPPHGIAAYVNESTYTDYDSLVYSLPDVEYSFVQVHSSELGSLTLAVVYKAPKCDDETFSKAMKDLKGHLDLSSSYVILGDFNIVDKQKDHDTWIDFLKKEFQSSQLVKDYTTCNDTTIDFVFSNVTIENIKVGIIDSVISDHKVITVECKCL